MEVTYGTKQPSYRLVHLRMVEQLGELKPKDHLRGACGNILPPYRFRYNEQAEAVMSRRTLLNLTGVYEQHDKVCKNAVLYSLRQALTKMDPYIRKQLLAEELAMDPNDPARARRITRRDGEPDDEYYFRVAKRTVALELYPPPEPEILHSGRSAGWSNPELVAAEQQRLTTGWTTDEEEESISNHYHGEYEYNDWSSEDGVQREVPTAPPRDRQRPVFSGNPQEETSEEDW